MSSPRASHEQGREKGENDNGADRDADEGLKDEIELKEIAADLDKRDSKSSAYRDEDGKDQASRSPVQNESQATEGDEEEGAFQDELGELNKIAGGQGNRKCGDSSPTSSRLSSTSSKSVNGGKTRQNKRGPDFEKQPDHGFEGAFDKKFWKQVCKWKVIVGVLGRSGSLFSHV